MPRKPKTLLAVELPPAFTEFMKHVHHVISIGDDAATTESDDLLQCGRVFGGLYDRTKRRYAFRYFHNDDATWDFELDARQISQIAAGTLTEVELWQCSSGNCDCLYSTEDSYCTHCDSVRHFDDYERCLRLLRPYENADVIAAMANLRKIGLAILDYHDKHGHFPPAILYGPAGEALHSWRSLILPFLDCEEAYGQIAFDQPWNSGTNRAVWDRHPVAYQSQHCPSHRTPCVAVVDDRTIWPTKGHRQVSDITSGTSHTVAVIQSRKTHANWMQPADIDIATAVEEYSTHGTLLAVFVDAHVDFIEDVDANQFRQFICV